MTIQKTAIIPSNRHLDVPLPEFFKPGIKVSYILNISPVYESVAPLQEVENDELDRTIEKIALQRIKEGAGAVVSDFSVRGQKALETPFLDNDDGWE
jgi:hypothetical protein